MKKLLGIFFIFFLLINFTLAQTYTSPPIDVTSQEAWRYFYDVFRPAADVACLQGATAFEKITNCIIRVLAALQYLAIILFLISLTLIAGFLVFSPVKKEYLDTAKKTFFWTILGFIIIFIAKEILEAINQLMR
ncbi:MAG: hypothetical protein NZ866_02510 [Patescibacteria group bacterium]|nr:hypothetical protein [Patescibacteria group bacterium]